MGQEISTRHFSAEDFQSFAERLGEETALLAHALEQGEFSRRNAIGGYELEAWLIDGAGHPAPLNEPYLERLNDALVSPELSKFNVELNSTPRAVSGDVFSAMRRELERNWQRCRTAARELDAELVMIGILPTVRAADLTLAQMSAMERYRALNEQVMAMRQGKPLVLDIHGSEHLRSEHHDVMLESATTSFQIHWQMAQSQAVRYYNAAQIISAPMVAVSANSPLLFGKRLWQETRIPLFEQAVAVGGFAGAAFGPVRRVSFGSGYARHSLLEMFRENLEHFPVLLPTRYEGPAAEFNHLRLHNGTIWRWNRPLIGFDEDGTPHLRLEHRVMAAGPSVIDAMANAAFFYGVLQALATAEVPAETQLSFSHARDNFYAAARHGLAGQVTWLGGERVSLAELVREQLLPLARAGLRQLGCECDEIDEYLTVIEQRVNTRRTGAQWQLDYLEAYPGDLGGLVRAYVEKQNSGLPVHRWSL